jgi:tetratricopeptide (TPR) repeat protein
MRRTWHRLAHLIVALLFAPPLMAEPARQARTPPSAAPPSFEELSKRADALRQAGQLPDAIAAYDRALRLKPSWTEGRWYVGTLNYELDKPGPAREAFLKVIAAQPENAGAWAFAGLCEFQLKKYEPALGDLMKARELHVASNKDLGAVVRYHAAILLTRFQQFELSQKVLSEFTGEGNDNPKVIEALGLSTLRIPLLPDELQPDRREQVLLAGQGTYYLYVHAMAAARKSLEELVRRYPDTPNTHYALGVMLLNEDPDAGIEAFKKELEVSPGSVHAMLQIAFEYIKRSRRAWRWRPTARRCTSCWLARIKRPAGRPTRRRSATRSRAWTVRPAQRIRARRPSAGLAPPPRRLRRRNARRGR